MLRKSRAAEMGVRLIFAKRDRIVVQLPILFAKRNLLRKLTEFGSSPDH